jgi:hypothetical protein
MSIAKIEKAVGEFIVKGEPESLSIRGGWGVGKTFFWNNYIKKNKYKINKSYKNYAYISLFGITSLEEFKFAIFQNLVDRDIIGESVTIENLKNNTEKLIKKFSRKSLLHIFSLPKLNSFGALVHTVSFSSVKDALICLDDIERKGNFLSTKDIFGLVSYLKENRNCKIVMIFNEANFDKTTQDDYKLFREKVIDVEVDFLPSSSEVSNIAFPNNTELDKQLREFSTKLDIKNIRILKKVRKAASVVSPMLKDFETELIFQASQTLTLLGWCYYSRDRTAPDFEYVKNLHGIFTGLQKEEQKTDDQLKWESILRSYNYSSSNDFDRALSSVIEKGYADEETIIKEATIINQQIIADKSQVSFSAAWELFHESFENNENEFVSRLEDSVTKHSKYVSPYHLNSAATILRELGREEIADKIVEIYIQENQDKINIFDLGSNPFRDKITDAYLMHRFNEVFLKITKVSTIEDVLKSLSTKNGWGPSDIQILASATEDDFYRIFKEKHDEHLSAYIETSLQFGKFLNASDLDKQISARAIGALKRIGRESKLNELRVRKYGIILD